MTNYRVTLEMRSTERDGCGIALVNGTQNKRAEWAWLSTDQMVGLAADLLTVAAVLGAEPSLIRPKLEEVREALEKTVRSLTIVADNPEAACEFCGKVVANAANRARHMARCPERPE